MMFRVVERGFVIEGLVVNQVVVVELQLQAVALALPEQLGS